MKKQSSFYKLLLLMPCSLGALFFFKTIHFAEVWDDISLLTHPLNDNNVSSFLAAVSDALYGFVLSPGLYWRPLGSLSFWWPSVVCGVQDSDCLLLVNHSINYGISLLFFLLTPYAALHLWRHYQGKNASANLPWEALVCILVSSLFITLHPANAEIFAWISGRFDALLSFFILLALTALFAPISVTHKSIFIFSFCCFGCLSKDGAQIGFLSLSFLALNSSYAKRDKIILAVIPMISLALMFFVRRYFSGEINFSVVNIGFQPIVFERYIASTSQAFLSLTQPWIGVSPAHPFKPIANQWMNSLFFHISLFSCAIFYMIALIRKQKTLLMWAFGLVTFGALSTITALNSFLVLNQDFVWADRYFAPLWPFLLGFLVLGSHELFHRFSAQRVFKLMFSTVSGLILLILCISQNQEINLWRDNPTFWARIVHEDPRNVKSLNNYAQALFQSGHKLEAEHQIDKSLVILQEEKRGFVENVRSAAAIKYALGKPEEALEVLTIWQSKGFDSFELRAQAGIIYYLQKHCREADQEADKAIDFSKHLPSFKTQRDLQILTQLKAQCLKQSNAH